MPSSKSAFRIFNREPHKVSIPMKLSPLARLFRVAFLGGEVKDVSCWT